MSLVATRQERACRLAGCKASVDARQGQGCVWLGEWEEGVSSRNKDSKAEAGR